jgi:uncharacterized protein YybS (DUF2232 family)
VLRYLLAAISGGIASALIYSLTGMGSFGGILLAYFAPLPLYLIGLSFGWTAGAVAGAVAALTITVVGGFLGAAIFVLINAMPALIIIRQALRSRPDAQGQPVWYPAGLLIISLSLTGAILYTVIALWLNAQPAGLEGSVRALVEGFSSQVIPAESADMRTAFVGMIMPLLPGIFAVSWMFMVVVNATLAQGLLVRFKRNYRPSPDIVTMEFPNWFPVAAATAALAGYVLPGEWGYYGVNLAMILILPFFFMGLAVVHALCRRSSATGFVLTVFYGLLIIFGWLAIIVAALGLIEPWVGLRRRFA